MKKQKLLVLSLATVLTIGGILGGSKASYAWTNYPAPISIENSDEDSLSKELLQKNILNEQELKIYVDATEKLMRLYDIWNSMEPSDAELEKLEMQEKAIFSENQAIFDKVFEYLSRLDAAPENMMEDVYKELLENGALNAEELSLYKEAEKKVRAIYDSAKDEDFTEEGMAKLLEKEELVYKEYKAIYDKIDAYYEKLEEKYYDDMIQKGELTKEEVKKLKLVDKKADALIATLKANASDEEIEKVYEQIDKLYEEIGF